MHPAPVRNGPSSFVRLVLDVPAPADDWVLSEENVPESNPHRDTVELLRQILLAFVARAQRNVLVAANLACRWDQARPQIGVDPDIALIDPAPPDAAHLPSLRTWVPGHVPPRFAVEVVSETNAEKDYVAAPAKYAALGTRELVVFDRTGIGPAAPDGPHVLQVWRRSEPDEPISPMVRVHAGDGPAFSEELGAWLIVAGERLRIASDPEGKSLWPTEAEAAEMARLGALRTGIEDMCELGGVPLDDARRAHLAGLDEAGLEALRLRLKRDRTWPAP